MMPQLRTLSLTLLLGLGLAACGGKKEDASAGGGKGQWTEQDLAQAKKGCAFGRKDDAAKVDKMCSCYVDKVVAASPDPKKVSTIPMADVTKINADCAQAAGL